MPPETPRGRGDGVYLILIELQNGAKPKVMLTGLPEQHYLLSSSGGYGFIAKPGDMVGRVKAGKVVMTADMAKLLCRLAAVYASFINPDCKIIAATNQKPRLASIGARIGKLWRKAKGCKSIKRH